MRLHMHMHMHTRLQVCYQITLLQHTDTIIDIVLVLDIVLQFFHGYTDQGYPVLNLRRVARRYAASWFVVDVVVVLPLDVLLGRSNTPLELLKLVRLVRIRRLTDNAKHSSMAEVP